MLFGRQFGGEGGVSSLAHGVASPTEIVADISRHVTLGRCHHNRPVRRH